jgi:hypothetical protein
MDSWFQVTSHLAILKGSQVKAKADVEESQKELDDLNLRLQPLLEERDRLQDVLVQNKERYHGICEQISDLDLMMRNVLEVLPKSSIPPKVEVRASQVPMLIDSCKELKGLALHIDLSPKPSRTQETQPPNTVIQINS